MRHLIKHNKKIALVVLLLVCGSTAFVCGLLAKYLGNSKPTGDTAVVALMASDVSLDLPTKELMYPGSEEVYAISLTNVSGDSICEVAQSYEMTVEKLTDNLNLTVEIYEDKDCETPATDLKGSFAAAKEESKTYYIKVSWPKESNSADKATQLDVLRVKVSAKQID